MIVTKTYYVEKYEDCPHFIYGREWEDSCSLADRDTHANGIPSWCPIKNKE